MSQCKFEDRTTAEDFAVYYCIRSSGHRGDHYFSHQGYDGLPQDEDEYVDPQQQELAALKARVAQLETEHCEMCAAVESQYRISIEVLTAERDKLAAQLEMAAEDHLWMQYKNSKLAAQVEKLRAFAQEVSIAHGLLVCHSFTKHELWDKYGSPTPLLTGEPE